LPAAGHRSVFLLRLCQLILRSSQLIPHHFDLLEQLNDRLNIYNCELRVGSRHDCQQHYKAAGPCHNSDCEHDDLLVRAGSSL
jgi:hypothetical protein